MKRKLDMKKLNLKLILITIIFLISQVGLIEEARGQGSIIVDNADAVIEHDLVNSTDLNDALGTVDPRIIVEYIDTLIEYGLINSTILDDLLDGVDPRIIVEYADTLIEQDLENSIGLDDALGIVDPRIIVEYVDALIEYGLINSTILDDLLDGVGPRIIVEYADFLQSLELVLNNAPNQPSSVGQYRSDASTIIEEGGSINESTIVFKAIVSDPDGDDIRLEIELHEFGDTFTGIPTDETISDYMPSGTEIIIHCYDLSEGGYHWQCRAKDSHGGTSDWQEYGTAGNTDFIIDLSGDMPPNTEITDGPSGTINYNDVIFAWTGSDDMTSTQDLIYSYYLEGYDSDWSPWTSDTSKSYNNLLEDNYTFKVKAKDESDNVDQTPDERSFTVDITADTPPNTEITEGPSGTINYNDVTFTWTGSDDITSTQDLVYSYYLEGYDSDWSPWTSDTSKYYNELPNGSYVFKVKAKDTSNNVDPTPMESSFQIKTPDWRNKMQIGDILIHRGDKSPLMYVLEWTHAGIYVGNGQIVEARAPWAGGVGYYDITDWDYPKDKYVVLLSVVSASKAQRDAAAEWAKNQAERDYGPVLKGYMILKEKSDSSTSPTWYCSELVWASYYNNGINLDDNNNPLDMVTPDEIYNDDDTMVIGSHKEYRPDTIFDIPYFFFKSFCPVDLNVTGPDNFAVNKELSEIEKTYYIESDFNNDNSKEDIVIIPNPKYGDYTIEVIPESNATLTDTFSLNATLGNQTITLAQDVLISEIPSEPYIIHWTEEGISIDEFPETSLPLIPGYNLFLLIALISLATILIYSKKRIQIN